MKKIILLISSITFLHSCSHVEKRVFNEKLEPCKLSRGKDTRYRWMYTSESCFALVAHFQQKVGVFSYSSGNISHHENRRMIWNPLSENFQDISGKLPRLRLGKAYLVKVKVYHGKEKNSFFSDTVRADVASQIWGIDSIVEVIKEFSMMETCTNSRTCYEIYLQKFNLSTIKNLLLQH